MNWFKSANKICVEKIGQKGNFQIWLVDGQYIRTNLDPEFTNFGQHYRYKYIPKNDFWIDKNTNKNKNERKFFIDHLIIENRLMSKGIDYNEALEKANLVEKKERLLSEKFDKKIFNKKKTNRNNLLYKKFYRIIKDGIVIWIVNGYMVRNLFDLNFTAGGHDYIYNYIPDKEIWIDDDVDQNEIKFVVLHEIHERNCMINEIPYDECHSKANDIELKCRHNIEDIYEVLKKEGFF
jgi:hypothetical protein